MTSIFVTTATSAVLKMVSSGLRTVGIGGPIVLSGMVCDISAVYALW